MDVTFIDMEDNRSAYDADSIEGWNGEGMPAGTIREFFVRLGNVSGYPLDSVPVGIVGDHSYRVTLSFQEFGSYSDYLALDSLADGKSKNLYLKLTMPNSVEDETITNWLVVGNDKLPITYQSSRAITTLFDPYPLWEGEHTADIFDLFVGKPVHRFYRFDPIKNVNGSEPQEMAGRIRFSDCDICEYFNAANRRVGYHEPVYADLNCIPTPREVTSPVEWQPTEPDDYSYEDRSNVFLPADFLNHLGNESPKWTFFHRESTDHIPDGLGKALVSTSGLDRFKRTQFLMEREGRLYSLEHLQPVMRGQQLVYYRAELRLLQEPAAGNPRGYNPFGHVYDEDSNRVIDRYPCWNAPSMVTVPGTGSGSGEAALE